MPEEQYGFWARLFNLDKVDELATLKLIHKKNLVKLSNVEKQVEDKEMVLDLFRTVTVPTLRRRLLKAETLAAYYKAKWDDALHIPDISRYVENPVSYVPRTAEPRCPVRYTAIADREYYVYPYETWMTVLDMIHKEVKDELPRWIREISDCDDFSRITDAAVRLAFIEAGSKRPAAFGYAEGSDGVSGHAYNFFRTSGGEYFVYEPQTGKVVGKLDEMTGVYQTYRLDL